MKRMKRNRYKGQATVETLVSLLALAPLLIIVPYIGKYLDVKAKAAEATRYTTWERTVWSDPGARWGADENTKSDGEISEEARRRILSDPKQGVANNVGPTPQNPLWTHYNGDSLLAGEQAPIDLNLTESAAPISRGTTVETVSDSFSFAGLSNLGLGLNLRSYVESRSRISVAPLPTFDRRGAAIDISLPDSDSGTLDFAGSAAILTDAWTPSNEQNFADRVDGLSVDEPLSFLVFPGTEIFGAFEFFQEGRKGRDPDLRSDTTIIPNDYIDAFGL